MPGPPSALVGKPPLTADDALIVHGWQVLFDMKTADPSKGLRVALKPPPPGTPHESDTTSIAVGAAVSMVLMVLFTGTRLVIRTASRNLTFGYDDWAIIFACVGTLLPQPIWLHHSSFHVVRWTGSVLPLVCWSADNVQPKSSLHCSCPSFHCTK